MDRLTHERSNGIKTGYWSPHKKDELVQALAAYEDTGLTPEEIEAMKKKQIPMEVTDIHVDDFTCLGCGCEDTTLDIKQVPEFCRNCGQALFQKEN